MKRLTKKKATIVYEVPREGEAMSTKAQVIKALENLILAAAKKHTEAVVNAAWGEALKTESYSNGLGTALALLELLEEKP